VITDKFTDTAKHKIAYLIKKDDFGRILVMNNKLVILEFKKADEREPQIACSIDVYGRVDWSIDNINSSIE